MMTGAGVPGFSASFGIAALAPDDDLDSLFARADRALYQAKHEGRNRFVIAEVDRRLAGETLRPAFVRTVRGKRELTARL